MNKPQHADVFSIITNRIIEQLEQQFIPWRKPWSEGGQPQNLISKRHYTGINTWLLGSLGYAQNYFLTWKQAQTLGAAVKKGEKGTMIVFWKRLQNQSEDDIEQKKITAVLRYYYVFNVAQIENLPSVYATAEPPEAIVHISACDDIVQCMPNCSPIKHDIQKAYYNPAQDYINMPKQESFITPESYYCALFHEMVHSTGHQSRLNRKEVVEPNRFGSEPYSIEELTAEIGACYLNSVAGIMDAEFENSVAYIGGWIRALKGNKRMIVYASGQAQRATDYILNISSYKDSDANEDVSFKTQ
jgi:antirestriction protein ArdC